MDLNWHLYVVADVVEGESRNAQPTVPIASPPVEELPPLPPIVAIICVESLKRFTSNSVLVLVVVKQELTCAITRILLDDDEGVIVADKPVSAKVLEEELV